MDMSEETVKDELDIVRKSCSGTLQEERTPTVRQEVTVMEAEATQPPASPASPACPASLGSPGQDEQQEGSVLQENIRDETDSVRSVSPTLSVDHNRGLDEGEEEIIVDVDTVDSKPSAIAPICPSPEVMEAEKTDTVKHFSVMIKQEEEGVPIPAYKVPSPKPHQVPEPLRIEENPTQALRLTNFSICEILKPEFGPKTRDSKPWRPQNPRCSNSQERRRARAEQVSPEGSRLSSPERVDPAYRLTTGTVRREGLSQVESPAPQSGTPGPHGAPMVWPAWVYCTRYSDRPSSGPRSRKIKRKEKNPEEKRPRTAFTNEQLKKLKEEFEENRYLTEERRQRLARDLDLNESQIKIWFQNKRAKMKKASGVKNALALQLMAQGLYQHSTCVTND